MADIYPTETIPGFNKNYVNEVVSFTEEIPHIYVTVQEFITSTCWKYTESMKQHSGLEWTLPCRSNTRNYANEVVSFTEE